MEYEFLRTISTELSRESKCEEGRKRKKRINYLAPSLLLSTFNLVRIL
jgi:hypothetical protein